MFRSIYSNIAVENHYVMKSKVAQTIILAPYILVHRRMFVAKMKKVYRSICTSNGCLMFSHLQLRGTSNIRTLRMLKERKQAK